MQRRNFIRTTALSSAGIGLAETGMANLAVNGKSKKRLLCAFTKCLQFLTIEEGGKILAKNGWSKTRLNSCASSYAAFTK